VHLLDQPAAGAQAQARAFFLGADKGLEDLVPDGSRDARPRIRDLDDNRVRRRQASQPQAASLRHGLLGVQHQVQQDLFELLGIGCRQRTRLTFPG
jgi:hypothetical protein